MHVPAAGVVLRCEARYRRGCGQSWIAMLITRAKILETSVTKRELALFGDLPPRVFLSAVERDRAQLHAGSGMRETT
jgi:hypothetical protein